MYKKIKSNNVKYLEEIYIAIMCLFILFMIVFIRFLIKLNSITNKLLGKTRIRELRYNKKPIVETNIHLL